jgi:hypothetical protein
MPRTHHLRDNYKHNIIFTRRAQDNSTFGCTPPPPVQFPVYNAESNTTTYVEIPQKVNQVEIIFDYEVRHWSNVQWDEASTSAGESEREGGFISNLFGRSGNNSSEIILQDLENVMVTEIWKTLLKDDAMTWDSSGDECAGLIIESGDDVSSGNDAVGTDDNAELTTPLLETKLLSLDVYPPDVVNTNGCIHSADTCTSIHGKMSATYIGNNEYEVSQTVTKLVRSGMETGQFISEGSLALMLEFQGASDMSAGETGVVIPLNTDRGTIWDVLKEDENDYISKYGKLFVSLLAILGTGFILATIVRRRRSRLAKASQAAELADGHEGDLALDENALDTERLESAEDDLPMKHVTEEDEEIRVDEEKNGSSSWGLFGGKKKKEEPQSSMFDVEETKEEEVVTPAALDAPSYEDVLNHVDLSVPPAESDEVEISLSPRSRPE